MDETIVLKQFNGSVVTPKDDAIIYDMLTGVNGIITGCDLTHMGEGKIKISEGRGIIKGRQFVVQEHVISVGLADVETMQGRVYIHMDLSNTMEPISIKSETAAELTDLIQDEDCNRTNGVFEIELGTYKAGVLYITDLKKTAYIVDGNKNIVDNLSDALAVTEDNVPVGCKAVSELCGKLGNCWISFTDADGNPTDVPYIHWYADDGTEVTG